MPPDVRQEIGGLDLARYARRGTKGGPAAPFVPPAPPSSPTLPFRARVMSASQFRRALGAELRRLAAEYPKGKRRRSWKSKAYDVERCGRTVAALSCGGCGDVLVKSGAVVTSCDLRVCPICARRRAQVLRKKLQTAWETRKPHRKMGLYFLTFTLRYNPEDPHDVSVEGLSSRRERCAKAWSRVWRRYLKDRASGAVRAIEVSARGAVHLHVLYYGRRPDIEEVRKQWMWEVGNSPMVNVRYVRKPGKAICELAKYVTKGASPAKTKNLGGARGEYTDPILAARIEIAFSAHRAVECYGSWRGIAEDEEEEQETFEGEACTKCGLVGEWIPVSYEVTQWVRLFGDRWKPKMARAGPWRAAEGKRENANAEARRHCVDSGGLLILRGPPQHALPGGQTW